MDFIPVLKRFCFPPRLFNEFLKEHDGIVIFKTHEQFDSTCNLNTLEIWILRNTSSNQKDKIREFIEKNCLLPEYPCIIDDDMDCKYILQQSTEKDRFYNPILQLYIDVYYKHIDIATVNKSTEYFTCWEGYMIDSWEIFRGKKCLHNT